MSLILILVSCLAVRANVVGDNPGDEIQVRGVTTARGAERVVSTVDNTDEEALEMGNHAIEHGMSTTVVTDDGNQVSAGYGFGFGAAPAGTVPYRRADGTVVYVPQGNLLGANPNAVQSVPSGRAVTTHPGAKAHQSYSDEVVPCPTDRLPETLEERVSCNEQGIYDIDETLIEAYSN